MEAFDRVAGRLRGAALLAALATLAVSCSSSDSTAPQPMRSFKFVVSTLHVPSSAGDAASLGVDLNGDGTPDDALGAVFAVLQQQGLAFQAEVDAAIASGAMEHLIRVSSHDTTLTQDQGATVGWDVGAGSAPFPGPYSIDNNYPAGSFTGSFASGTFASPAPATMAVPVGVTVKLFLGAGSPVFLHLNGAAIRFTATGSAPALASGRVAGSLTTSDVQNNLIPGLAQAFNALIQADTASSTARQLESLFDTGGCAGGVANDFQIAVCELAGNALLSTLLAPDVQVYNSVGGYAPSAANASPNALSAAFGFTAQLTSF